MAVDSKNSVYIGGLPYSATEDSIRNVFDLYGAIDSVKIINNRSVNGKCYGFVTYRNPRSAIDAINDMNGRTIGGRVVRVNGVTNRGKSNVSQDHYEHMDRDVDRDRGRDPERDYDHDRDRDLERYSDRSRERDRSFDRDQGRGRGYQSQERYMHDDEQRQRRNGDLRRRRDIDLERNQGRGEMEAAVDNYHIFDWDRDSLSMKQNGIMYNTQHTRETSPRSYYNDDCLDDVTEELERAMQKRDERRKEISLMEEGLGDKKKLVSDLQKKAKKLEEELVNAKKLSSHQNMQLNKLHKCFLQVREYNESLRSFEQELQSLVDAAMIEIDRGTRIGS